jgi:hypothetical protein
MRKIELEHLLENAVAKAIGVKPPHDRIRTNRPVKKAASQHRPVRHAA